MLIGQPSLGASTTVIQFDHQAPSSRMQQRVLPTSPLLLGQDADDDKYRRRSPMAFLSRWWRSVIGMYVCITDWVLNGERGQFYQMLEPLPPNYRST